jgi:4-hydroxy-tetrahydrodipicolinate synthase
MRISSPRAAEARGNGFEENDSQPGNGSWRRVAFQLRRSALQCHASIFDEDTMNFSGAMTALITPFRDGKLDEARFKAQIERQIAGGVTGIVPVGTTGESPTLSVKEHERVIELAVQTAAGRVKVIAGTGANATGEAIELHRHAKAVGADAGLSVNPYYNKPTQEGLYAHFMAISDAVDLPIVLYNVPARTGITMTPATVSRLYNAGNCPCIKEATGSLDIATEIMGLCEIQVVSGVDELNLPLLSIGAVGLISVLSNIMPAKVAGLVNAFTKGDATTAAQIHHDVFRFTKALFIDGNPVGIKAAMQIAGLDSGELRLPLVPASESTRTTIAAEMKKLGL